LLELSFEGVEAGFGGHGAIGGWGEAATPSLASSCGTARGRSISGIGGRAPRS
jgi:hypothetical protein